MPKITVNVPHSLPPAEALEKIKPALDKTAADFQGRDVEMHWTETGGDFSFKSMTFTIKGTVAVSDQAVVVDIELPFAAIVFKEQAGKALSKNLTRALADAGPS